MKEANRMTEPSGHHPQGARLRDLSSAGRLWLSAGLAAVLGYSSTLWLVVVHQLQGVEQSDLPLVLHWLRDATLAMPAIFAVVWLAVSGVCLVLRREDATSVSLRLERVLAGTAAAFATSVASAAVGPVQGALFGASGTKLPL